MTTEQINERIALLCGWQKLAPMGSSGVVQWVDPSGINTGWQTPDYYTSLDACRAFEDNFNELELTEYAVHLRRIVTRNVERDNEPKNPDTLRIPDGRYYCAKSHERCEAVLSMKGQWDEN